MILPYLHDRLIGTPLLLSPERAATIMAAIGDRIGLDAAPLPMPQETYTRPAKNLVFDRATGIATLPIVGSLVHRSGGLEALSGIASYTTLQAQFSRLLDDPKVRGILLDIDSGGGEVAGLAELAEFIVASRDVKPIWSIANSIAASAAYWLASAAEKVVVTPQGSVGSIGVIVIHVDRSAAVARAGLKPTIIHAGQYKAAGNPFAPLPDDVRDSIQARVDTLWGEFIDAVASNRGISAMSVRDTQAAMFSGADAVAVGLADAVGHYGAAVRAMAEELSSNVYALGGVA